MKKIIAISLIIPLLLMVPGAVLAASLISTTQTITQEIIEPSLPSGGGGGGIPMFTLYDLTIENITEGSADILWETSRPTTSKLTYWSISETTIENETRASEHIVGLEELEDNTTYYFEITCRDEYGQEKSITGEFTTLEAEVIIVPEPEVVEPTSFEPFTGPEEPTEPEEEPEGSLIVKEPEEPTEPLSPLGQER